MDEDIQFKEPSLFSTTSSLDYGSLFLTIGKKTTEYHWDEVMATSRTEDVNSRGLRCTKYLTLSLIYGI